MPEKTMLSYKLTSNTFSHSIPQIPAVLLAAGMGTRLAPITEILPKCLAPINGKPLLSYWLNMCRNYGLKTIINSHYKAEMVSDYIYKNYGNKHIEIIYEKSLLGTFGTLVALKNRLKDGPFLAIHADNLSFFSLEQFWMAHLKRPSGCIMTMMLFKAENPESAGIVRLNNEGVVTEFFEKSAMPPGNLANGAVYIMEPEIFSVLKPKSLYSDISIDLLPLCLGRIFTFYNEDYHRDIGTVESYAKAQVEMWSRINGISAYE